MLAPRSDFDLNLNDYDIGKFLHRGTFADDFLAKDLKHDGREVVLKNLHRYNHIINNPVNQVYALKDIFFLQSLDFPEL